jgi:hypothetical protein
MSKYKIKTIKEYLKEGPPQFDIILRREAGKVVHVSILSGDELEELGGNRTISNMTLHPPENGNGIIQIVKRISDDQIFHQQDMVEADGVGSCFIVEFKEDLIHCAVANLFDQTPIVVEINALTVHELIVGHEESEDTQAG